jgi:hydroxymethylbilane synthase
LILAKTVRLLEDPAPMANLILATRKSPLALAQSEKMAAFLQGKLGVACELLKITTTGDRQAEWSLEAEGGKGLFTHELEQAVLEGRADGAVHSTKDLPGDLPAGLGIAGYLPRADPHDILVLRSGVRAPKTLATGSPRRRLQAAVLFPWVQFLEIRGNVDTRLRKIGEQQVADGTILAAAGLNRLGINNWPGVEFHALGLGSMVPAVGQGAIAFQTRLADVGRFQPHFDAETARGVGVERALQSALGAGCHTAFAACVVKETLYFYHEATGARTFTVGEDDFQAPGPAADRILAGLGLAHKGSHS